MAKTLANMTAEERAECVGMWADTTRQGLGVVVNATEPSDCWVLFPKAVVVSQLATTSESPRVLICRVHGHQTANQYR